MAADEKRRYKQEVYRGDNTVGDDAHIVPEIFTSIQGGILSSARDDVGIVPCALTYQYEHAIALSLRT